MPTYKLSNGRLTSSAKEFDEVLYTEWRGGVRKAGGQSALVLPNNVDINEMTPNLANFGAVILEFPTFRDGRAYSQARLLRERFGYCGAICARGDIGPDQILFMARTGFDAFELADGDVAQFANSLAAFSCFYQTATDCTQVIWRLRISRAKAA